MFHYSCAKCWASELKERTGDGGRDDTWQLNGGCLVNNTLQVRWPVHEIHENRVRNILKVWFERRVNYSKRCVSGYRINIYSFVNNISTRITCAYIMIIPCKLVNEIPNYGASVNPAWFMCVLSGYLYIAICDICFLQSSFSILIHCTGRCSSWTIQYRWLFYLVERVVAY